MKKAVQVLWAAAILGLLVWLIQLVLTGGPAYLSP